MGQVFEQIAWGRGGVGATLEHHPLGGPVLRLTAPGGTAEIAVQGAQLLSWQPRGHAPALWLSPMARLAMPAVTPKPVRGGTPVCWPWFGPHPSDAAKPAHGFVRTRSWQVDGAWRTAAAVRIRLSTATTAADMAVWPHAARAELSITLGDTLSLALTTANTGPCDLPLTQALHTYFAVGDSAAIAIEGLADESYTDKLDAGARRLQAGDIVFSGEVDRIYDQHAGAAVIVDRSLNRRIEITKSGSRSTVIWNPWVAKALLLGDMGPDGHRRMVCVETSNAGSDIVTVAPGEEHTLSASYRVGAL